jgi:hypothetical protein
MDDHDCQPFEGFQVSFPGPFQHHDVVVNGWRVPFLQAHLPAEDRVSLVLDRRIGTQVSVEEAERIVPFIAHAIAMALGYPSHPNGDMDPPLTRDPHPRPVRTMELFPTGPESDVA